MSGHNAIAIHSKGSSTAVLWAAAVLIAITNIYGTIASLIGIAPHTMAVTLHILAAIAVSRMFSVNAAIGVPLNGDRGL
jgi:S-formylglutathione hydrolase FrmB